MPFQSPEYVSSLKTIANSIEYDPQVSRWFLLLVEQRVIREKVLKNSPGVKQAYRLLGLIPFVQFFLGIFCLSWVALAFESGNYLWLWPLVLAPYPVWRLIKERRILIARISQEFLGREFPGEALRRKTLYQVAEILSRAYGVPSLVDTIYHWDRFLRAGTIIFFMTATFIIPSRVTLYYFLTFGIFMLLIKTILRSQFIYRRFR